MEPGGEIDQSRPTRRNEVIMKTAILLAVCAVLGVLLGVGMARVQLGAPTIISLPDADSASFKASSSVPTPRVSVDAETFDFGSIERHASMSHNFQFTNVGDAPLRLTVGDTSCKCTVGEAPEGLVEPGQTVPVTLNWRADTGEAEFRQNATIYTNDPLRQSVSLTVVGRVIEASSFFPRYFELGNVPTGKSRSAAVTIFSSKDESFEVTGTEFVGMVSEEHFDVAVEELSPDEFPSPEVRSAHRVTVTSKASLPFGHIRGGLKIKTTLDRVPELEVPLTGKVVSDFRIIAPGYNAEKDQLVLGPVVGQEGTERTLYILSHGEEGAAATLTVEETSPAFLEAELGERKQHSGGSTQTPLTIRVPAGSPAGIYLGGQNSELGRIVIHTTHPRVPELTIGVRFTVE
jgi:Protein of unknown function (DUF1573)